MAETEMVRAVRKSERVVLPHRLSLDQAKQSLVEGLEPFARALLDGLTDRLQLAPPDQRLDAGGDEIAQRLVPRAEGKGRAVEN
jgi:hypothetical protein